MDWCMPLLKSGIVVAETGSTLPNLKKGDWRVHYDYRFTYTR